jgi:hypothetical protein
LIIRAMFEEVLTMSVTVDAVYENGVLKLAQPLPFPEHEKVRITVMPAVNHVRPSAGLIGWTDIPADAPVNHITDWPSSFDQIRQRPGMWLGSPSLTALENLLRGIVLAEYLYGVPEEKHLGGFPFDEFERWAETSFNPERLSLNSFSLARREADSEEAAFLKWLGWYDQFRSERSDA